MKKHLLLLSLFFAFSFSNGTAQEYEQVESLNEYKNHFYFNPFVVFAGTFQVGFEHNFNTGSIMLVAGGILADNDWTYKEGFNSELHYKFEIYNYQKSLNKIKGHPRYNIVYYMAPHIQFKKQKIICEDNWWWGGNSETHDATASTYAGGVMFGTKVIMFQKLTMDIYAGGAIKYTDTVGDDPGDFNCFTGGIFSPFYTGVTPKMGLQFGINF
ncbi:MAG: hypothetical protein JKY33_04015 [Bacteroidia bacterium]|nr:hypothetical protein [Bacteroidia bacterium]